MAIVAACGVSQSLVSHWCTGLLTITPDKCPNVEAVSGVRCEALRPDLMWIRDEAGAVTHYAVPVRAA
jgi:DNA-binding transcriptional regulator YdaS (Cro superfamily)